MFDRGAWSAMASVIVLRRSTDALNVDLAATIKRGLHQATNEGQICRAGAKQVFQALEALWGPRLLLGDHTVRDDDGVNRV